MKKIKINGEESVYEFDKDKYVEEASGGIFRFDKSAYWRGPKSNPTLDKIIDKLSMGAEKKEDKINKFLNFIEDNISYKEDPLNEYLGEKYQKSIKFNFTDYPKTPMQTLADRCGDCEDITNLFNYMMNKSHIDSGFAIFKNKKYGEEGHMLSAVEMKNEKYFFRNKLQKLIEKALVKNEKLLVPVKVEGSYLVIEEKKYQLIDATKRDNFSPPDYLIMEGVYLPSKNKFYKKDEIRVMAGNFVLWQ